MNCPICGRQTADGAKKCSHCGTHFKRLEASLLTNQENTPKNTPSNRKKRTLLGIGIGLASAVVCVLLFIFWGPKFPVQEPVGNTTSNSPDFIGSFIPYEHHIYVESGTGGFSSSIISFQSPIQYLYDTTLVQTEFRTNQILDQQCSLDGSVLAFLTVENNLYSISESTCQLVAENVASFQLSTSGQNIAYFKEDSSFLSSLYTNSLYLFDIQQAKSTVIAEKALVRDYTLTPDGKGIAYSMYTDDFSRTELFYNQDGQCFTLTNHFEDATLITASNGGTYIYTSQKLNQVEDGIYCYGLDHEPWLLGCRNTQTRPQIITNADHSQLLFYGIDGTYIVTKDQEAHLVSPYMLEPVLPGSCKSIYRTNHITVLPYDDLYGHVYCEKDLSQPYYRMYYLQENINDTRFLTTVEGNFRLDDSGQYLYYVSEGTLRYMDILHPEKSIFLADLPNNTSFVISPDRSLVAFVRDGSLYTSSGMEKSKQVLVTDQMSSNPLSSSHHYDMEFDKGNRLLYIPGFNTLFTYTQGDEAPVNWNYSPYSLERFPNGIIYARAGDKLAICNDGYGPVIVNFTGIGGIILPGWKS